jgi:predicted Rossmann fold flavoprotein
MIDVLIVGAGPAGLTAAIAAARHGVSVRVIDAGPAPGRKLLASGGGRCNLTNTLPAPEFMARFGRQGRFMQPALRALDAGGLRTFLADLGVDTHVPDGRRVFPIDHRARTVLDALLAELARLGVGLQADTVVTDLATQDGRVAGVVTTAGVHAAGAVVLACGGPGYPALGGTDAGALLAARHGHRLAPWHPGMVALHTREDWPARSIADTVAAATLTLRRPGQQRLTGTGDLIFTRQGLAGPVVLDLAREVTPLLDDEGPQRVALELTGRDQDAWRRTLGDLREATPRQPIAEGLHRQGKVAASLAAVMCELAGVGADLPLERLGRSAMARLASTLARVEVTVIGHAGWDHAMVARGGVELRDVHPESLESRRLPGLYLAGEVLDLDGPCGGFNLQWAFASGHLAGLGAAGR